MFEIDEKSGEIKVKVPLDRDPPNGRPVWSFNVLATDNGGKNGLDGYAEVQVNCNKNRGVHKMRLPGRHFLFIFFRQMDGQTDGPTF